MAITDEKYVLLTEVDSGKVKRIRNNPSVTLQPCTLRGKVTEGAEVVTATADVLLGADAHPVTKAVRRKYRLAILMLDVGTLFRKLLCRKEPEECAIRLRFD